MAGLQSPLNWSSRGGRPKAARHEPGGPLCVRDLGQDPACPESRSQHKVQPEGLRSRFGTPGIRKVAMPVSGDSRLVAGPVDRKRLTLGTQKWTRCGADRKLWYNGGAMARQGQSRPGPAGTCSPRRAQFGSAADVGSGRIGGTTARPGCADGAMHVWGDTGRSDARSSAHVKGGSQRWT